MPFKAPGPGHDLLRISQETGVSRQDILSSAENKDLFAAREHAVLFEEDEVWIPEAKPKQLRVRVGTMVYLIYSPPKRTLHLVLTDESGRRMWRSKRPTHSMTSYRRFLMREFEHNAKAFSGAKQEGVLPLSAAPALHAMELQLFHRFVHARGIPAYHGIEDYRRALQ